MKLLRDKIIKCLNDFAENEDELLSKINKIILKEGKQTYIVIFHVLTSLVLEEKEAEQCWHDIVKHCNIMSTAIGRRVSLRTAICDYFCSVNKSLRNPKVVEINIFEKAAKSSQTDSLTGLYNRRHFDGEIVKEIARAKRHNTPLSILFLDLDDFKKINDTFGHVAGDKVLKQVAHVIMKEKRTEDLAARYGGEELVIISPETGKANTLILGERIRKKVEKMKINYESQTISLTVSGGLASYPVDADNPLTLLKYADNALYRAKTSGKNNISLFSEDKRRYIRIDFNNIIKAEGCNQKKSPKNITVTGKNLSEGGILIETDHSIEIGKNLTLEIDMDGTKMQLKGKVVRVEEYSAKQYEIGLAFLEITKKPRNELANYLIRQLKKTSEV